MKKTLKILLVFSILIMILISCCYADNLGLGDLGNYKGNNIGSSNLNSKAGNILGIIQLVGVVISVVMLVVIGIKYMLGSLEERAEYKKTLVPYLIGAFFIFTGTLVPQMIYTFMQNF